MVKPLKYKLPELANAQPVPDMVMVPAEAESVPPPPTVRVSATEKLLAVVMLPEIVRF